jgi:PAS domain S-box-containing protein
MTNLPKVPEQPMRIAEDTVDARLALLNLSPRDRHCLSEAWDLVEANADRFIHGLYARFESTPTLAAILGHESRVLRLRSLHREYLRQLFCDQIDENYVAGRTAIGQLHHRIRVTPQWYIATCAHFLCEHVEVCLRSGADIHEGIYRVDTLFKSMMFDVSVTLDAYGRSERAAKMELSHVGEPDSNDSYDDSYNWAGPASLPGSHEDATGTDQGGMRRIRLDADEITNRIAYIGLDEQSLSSLRAMGPSAERVLPAILEEFYDFIQLFPELRALVPDPIMDRLTQQVASYWRELLAARFDTTYAASRMRIGVIHDQVGLELQWYLAGLTRQVSGLIQSIDPNDPELSTKLRSLLRAVCFDATFVVDAYMEARAASLLKLRGFAHQLMHGLTSAVVIVDDQARILFANEPFVALSGVEPGLLYQMSLADVMPSEVCEAAFAQLRESSSRRVHRTMRRGDRVFRMTLSQLDAHTDRDRPPVVVAFDDMSEMLRLSDTIESEGAQYRKLTSHVVAVLWEMDWNSRTILSISQPTIDMLGYRDVALLGRTEAWSQAIVDEDRGQFEAACSALATKPHATCEYRMRTADGRVIWVRSHLSRISLNANEQQIAAVTVDITQAKEADRLRMAATEHVATGVSHAINNALTVVLANMELYRSRLDTTDATMPNVALLDNALDGARRASRVVSDLLAFTGQQFLRPVAVNLNQLLKASLPTMQLWVGEAVSVQLDLDPGLPVSHVDSDQFLVAIGQLCSNARQAMPSGGVLAIRTSRVTGSELQAAGAGKRDQRRYAEVVVADNGVGMTEEVRMRAVDPFFTTATFPKHDGLGLSMVHGFMVQSGGQLLLESQLGQGTRIRLWFPELARELITDHPCASDVAQPTILIVDSDTDILRTTQQIIQDRGYRTLVASDAEQALTVTAHSSVELVLTEVRLRGQLDGIGLARQLVHSCPTLAVILMYAGHGSPLMKENLPSNWTLLQKPFTAGELTDPVRSSLQKRIAGLEQRVRLTDREREVLRHIAMGKTQIEVGEVLGISERTVEQHIRAVRRKLNASNTIQAVVEAIHRQEI